MKLKISPKDMKLLLLLFALLILSGSYFFVYQKNIEKRDLLKEEDIKLEQQVKVLEDKVERKQEVIDDTNQKQEDLKQITNQFPPEITTEKTIVLLDNFEKTEGFSIEEESFSMNELMYQKGEEGDTTETTGEKSNYKGYRSNITVSFKSSYEALKKVMNQIYKSPSRMTVDEMALTYDSETGDLKGTMVINLYSLKGTDRVYEPPVIQEIETGVPNIFHSKKE